MEAHGLGPDMVAYTTAISALSRGGQAEEALRLFERVKTRPGLQLDERAYHAALDACARGGGGGSGHGGGEEGDSVVFWRQALALVGEMEARGMGPGRLGYQSAVQACAQAGRWEEALGVLRGMRGACVGLFGAVGSSGVVGGMERRGVTHFYNFNNYAQRSPTRWRTPR